MNLYLDDDTAKALLATLLRRAGHRVVVPADVGLRGAADAEHLLHTVQNDLILITRNHDGFRTLHLQTPSRISMGQGVTLPRGI